MKAFKTATAAILAIVIMVWLISYSKVNDVGFLKPALAVIVSGSLCSYAVYALRNPNSVKVYQYVLAGVGFCAIALVAMFIFMSGFAQ
jgi:hypothetical protein